MSALTSSNAPKSVVLTVFLAITPSRKSVTNIKINTIKGKTIS
nr:hypothetical protein [Methanosphaera sp.]